jgi:hypothetical protein
MRKGQKFLELNIFGVINRLSNWNTDRVRKKERLKIYNQYKSGDISYDEYVKQRKELEERLVN